MQKETSHHNSQMGKRQSHQTGLVTEVAQSVKYSVPTDRQHPLNIYRQVCLGLCCHCTLKKQTQ